MIQITWRRGIRKADCEEFLADWAMKEEVKFKLCKGVHMRKNITLN